jgi:putative FmdB family regulatory protein
LLDISYNLAFDLTSIKSIMPIYDFKCTECGHQDEMMRKASAENTMECPACHKKSFSKMLSAPSFQLNGTGWYATDFKNKPKTQTATIADTKPDDAAPAASCAPGCGCH